MSVARLSLPSVVSAAAANFMPSVMGRAVPHEHSPFDDPADVALCLAFAKLSREEVEMISDASPMTEPASWT